MANDPGVDQAEMSKLIKALQNLLSFYRERFSYLAGCQCDGCKIERQVVEALRSFGRGERGAEWR